MAAFCFPSFRGISDVTANSALFDWRQIHCIYLSPFFYFICSFVIFSSRDRGSGEEPREAAAATEHQRGRLRGGGHPHDEKLLGRRASGEARFPAAQGHHKEAQQVRLVFHSSTPSPPPPPLHVISKNSFFMRVSPILLLINLNNAVSWKETPKRSLSVLHEQTLLKKK